MEFLELNTRDVNIMLKEHKDYFESHKTRNIQLKINSLNKLRESILKYEPKIQEALYKDLGKSEFESYVSEIGFVLSSIRHTIKKLKQWGKPKSVSTPLSLFPSKSYIISEPYGTVLIIGPYNYPFQLLIEPLIGAISAGNCVVLKPSENSPNISSVVTEMINETFDKEFVRCVEGGIDTNTALANAPFDYIFFTGSVSVGRIIMQAAAKNLVPVTLELGGKSPVIVDKSADIKVSAQRIIWGKTLNAGQTCVAPDYLLVHESIKDNLITELKKQIHAFYGADIINNKDFGCIINKRHFDRLSTILEKDKDNIIFGGSTNKENLFIEPTLIKVTSWDAASMSEELFGPILPIITYSNLDDAIHSIKKLSKPLALYLFTSNKEIENKVLMEISSGGVCINDTISHLINPNLPFGGVGNSGIGSYHGKHSFDTFSHKKSVVKKSTNINLTLVFPPYTTKNLNIIKKLLK